MFKMIITTEFCLNTGNHLAMKVLCYIHNWVTETVSQQLGGLQPLNRHNLHAVYESMEFGNNTCKMAHTVL